MTKETLRKAKCLMLDIERLKEEKESIEKVKYYSDTNKYRVRVGLAGASGDDVLILLKQGEVEALLGFLKASIEKKLEVAKKSFEEL